jgi:hypothetical protein
VYSAWQKYSGGTHNLCYFSLWLKPFHPKRSHDRKNGGMKFRTLSLRPNLKMDAGFSANKGNIDTKRMSIGIEIE